MPRKATGGKLGRPWPEEPTADAETWAWVQAADRLRTRLKRFLKHSDYLALARELGYVKMNEQVHVIEHRLGTDGSIAYTVRDADGVPVDVSSKTVALKIRDYPGGAARSVTFAGTLTKTSAGLVTQPVADDELADLSPGDYALTVAVENADGSSKTAYPLAGSLILRLLPSGG
jgi:hypothetical protein